MIPPLSPVLPLFAIAAVIVLLRRFRTLCGWLVVLAEITALGLVFASWNSRPDVSGGWITVAGCMPDGTCRDDGNGGGLTTVAVREEGQSETSGSIRVVIRGVTGQVRVTTGGGQK